MTPAAVARVLALCAAHDVMEGELIALTRRLPTLAFAGDPDVARWRDLWREHDALEREIVTAFAALDPETAEAVRNGEYEE